MPKPQRGRFGRRSFLKTVATAGAASAIAPTGAIAAPQTPPAPPVVVRDPQTGRAPISEAPTTDRPASDYMIDLFKTLG